MSTASRRPLEAYLALDYPFQAVADPDGGYVIIFPDLPGCLTQVEDVAEIGPMADEVRTLWIETEYERGAEIPLPSYPEEYSGKFNLRLPRSLHRQLAETADREGVSLNHLVVALLSQGAGAFMSESRLSLLEEGQARLEGLLLDVATQVKQINSRITRDQADRVERLERARATA